MAVKLVAGERGEKESKSAAIACNDYLRMGVGRSLPALVVQYANSHQSAPPTLSLNGLKKWSANHNWQVRAETYDKAIDAEKTAHSEARRKAIMESGLAKDFERVNELNEIYDKLKLELIVNGLQYTDIKLSSRGDSVEVEVFNKPLIDSLRGVLDDIAKEVGGRKQKVDMEHSGGMLVKTVEGPKDVR